MPTHPPKHLIIVAGHAPFADHVANVPNDVDNDDYWILQSFQAGEPAYYIEHIRRGAELLQADPQAILMFTGGRTRPEAHKWSEAATYAAIAAHFDYWTTANAAPELQQRTALELHARDSLQNVEYSLYRFHQLHHYYPAHITAVGWEFKHTRFDLHRQALGIPGSAFTYIGVNNPQDLEGAKHGELKAIAQFRATPLGDEGELLQKRAERNPFNETSPYLRIPPIRIRENIR